jgi:hypothetical protein
MLRQFCMLIYRAFSFENSARRSYFTSFRDSVLQGQTFSAYHEDMTVIVDLKSSNRPQGGVR